MGAKILYCHCAYARVVPQETKTAVLEGLLRSGVEFEAVSDLCEMAARGDRRLAELAAGGGALRIAACYPRAVKWLFASAGVAIGDANVVVCNMRSDSAEQVLHRILVREADPSGAPGEPARLVPHDLTNVVAAGGDQ